MTINDETFRLINASHDGELSPSEAIAMERRIAAEPELKAMADRLNDLSAALGGALAGDPASEALRARVLQQIGLSEAPAPKGWQSSWRSLAAALVLGLLIGSLIGGGAVYMNADTSDSRISDAVFAGHLRSLIAPQPFDVASSDRHVVKPWFNGRTTIAPATPDLGDDGFPLLGGRIDIVTGKAVPSLVYHHDRHIISVTIIPRLKAIKAGEKSYDGSTVEYWSAGDLTYWAVSDLNLKDLQHFVELFKARVAQGG